VSHDGECCLDVAEVQESDAGLYTCIDEDKEAGHFGQQKKYSAFLVVVGKQNAKLINYLIN